MSFNVFTINGFIDSKTFCPTIALEWASWNLKKTQYAHDKTFVNVYYKNNDFYICSVNHVSYT
jgi:hypothetical protein